MSVTIRLAKIGKKNAPAFKVVVANTRDKRNGKVLDVLGHYNPLQKVDEQKLSIDDKKVKEWKEKGALISSAVEKLMAGDYVYTKYNPRAEEKTE